MNRWKKSRDNRGMSLVMVIGTVALVSILVVIVLSLSLMNIQMKSVYKKSADNFYDAEAAMDEIAEAETETATEEVTEEATTEPETEAIVSEEPETEAVLEGSEGDSSTPVAGGRTVDYYSFPANGGTWDGRHYIKPDGTMATDVFFFDGTYTYYLMTDGTPMTDKLTYHPF